MSEYRWDAYKKYGVIYAEERLKRPYHFSKTSDSPATTRTNRVAETACVHKTNCIDKAPDTNTAKYADKSKCTDKVERDCPFCLGNEQETSEEIDRIPDPEHPERWSVRAIFNKYPAVHPTQNLDDSFARPDDFSKRHSPKTSDFFAPSSSDFSKSPADIALSPSVFSGDSTSESTSFFSSKPPIQDWFQTLPGQGQHEVLVDSSRHLFSVSEMTDTEVIAMFQMYQKRLRSLSQCPDWSFANLFKNVGQNAGASIPHTHSQLVATPFVPPSVLEEIDELVRYRQFKKRKRGLDAEPQDAPESDCCDFLGPNEPSDRKTHEVADKMTCDSSIEMREVFDKKTRKFSEEKPGPPCLTPLEDERFCYFCDLIRQELKMGQRIVEETAHFVVFCPYVSRFAFEMTVCPKRHQSAFESFSDEAIVELALLIRRCVRRLECVPFFPFSLNYNLILRNAPWQMPRKIKTFSPLDYHCSWLLLPSFVKKAGFEWGTGIHINPVKPETAAQILKSVSKDVL